MSSEVKTKQSKKTEVKKEKIDSITKVYMKIMILLKLVNVDITDNDEVISSLQSKLAGLFTNQSPNHQLEALEFVISNKPKDMIEAHHLLNLFTVSDYMRMIGCQLHNGRVTHEQNQEYIKIAGKTAEQYSKGMLTLKAYREGLPQCNKIQNNTLNQLNIHAHKENDEPKKIETEGSRAKIQNKELASECKESLNTGKIVIKKKEEV